MLPRNLRVLLPVFLFSLLLMGLQATTASAIGSFTVTPDGPLDLGAVVYPATSTRAFTLTNNMGSDVTVNGYLVTNSGQWVVGGTCGAYFAGAPMPSGTSCNATVTVPGYPIGLKTQTFRVDWNDGTAHQVDSAITADSQYVGINPSGSGSFGGQRVDAGASAILSYSLTVVRYPLASPGLTATNVYPAGPDAGDFTFEPLSSTCASAIFFGSYLASGSCTLSVSFNPSTPGPKTAYLELLDNAGILVGGVPQPSPHHFALSGTGIVFVPTPSSNDFGTRVVSAGATAKQTFTIENAGNADLVISSVGLTGANSGDFAMSNNTCATTLINKATCTVDVSFDPSTSGAKTASLTFTDDAPDGPHSIALSGTGVAPEFAPSTGSASYGIQNVSHGATASASFVIGNTGSSDLNISGVALGGTDHGDFTITDDQCTGVAVSTIGTCTVDVAFDPASSGAKSATLVFTDDSDGSPHALPLDGTGSGAVLTPSQTPLTFATTPANSGATTTQSVTFTNDGDEILAFTGLSITGAAASDYVVFSDTCTDTNGGTGDNTIAPTETCDVTVAFGPTAGGTRAASLQVAGDAIGNPNSIPLTGVGTIGHVSSSAGALAFGSRVVTAGAAPAQSLTITNTGTFDVVMSQVTITGSGAAAYSLQQNCTTSSPLVPVGSCTITVTFDPATAGSFPASIAIANNGDDGPTRTIALSGSGIFECVVPKLVGTKLSVAKSSLAAAHCQLGSVKKVRSSKIKKGRIVSQAIKPGTHKSAGTKVAVKLSKGK